MLIQNFKELFNLTKLIPILTYQQITGESVLVIYYQYIYFVIKFLKQSIGFQFKMLSYISGVDFFTRFYRFCIVYDLVSIVYNSRLRIKIFLYDDSMFVSSVVSLFINANWYEREVWDLFGLYFNHHPDLRRILTDYGFEGYPLRKDFPLSGFVEVRFDEIKKRVSVESIELSQEFRLFNSQQIW